MLTIPNNAAALPADLKYSNRFSVLSQFRSNEQLTANNIADSLNLSRQTVMKNIQFFLKHGLLVSVGKAPSTNIGGKRPELFSLTDKLFLLCADAIRAQLTELGWAVKDTAQGPQLSKL